MGVGTNELAMLRMAYDAFEHEGARGIGRVLTLGRQNITREVARVLYPGITYKQSFADNPIYLDDALREIWGAEEVVSLDYSDYQGASLIFDLNSESTHNLPRDYFDLIVDFGTIEHIYNIPNALAAIRHMLKDGGRILHSVPADGHPGHGLYQVSPMFFLEVYSVVNGFESKGFIAKTSSLGHKRYWWAFDYTTARLEYVSGSPTALLIFARKGSGTNASSIYQTDYLATWQEHEDRSFVEQKTEKSSLRKMAKSSKYVGLIEDLYVFIFSRFSGFKRFVLAVATLIFPLVGSKKGELKRVLVSGTSGV